MRISKAGLAALVVGLTALSPAVAKDAEPDLSGVSPSCQQAYRSMRMCLDKTLAAGAPDSIRAPWEKQIADSVQMWRAMRGKPEVEKSCKAIAEKPDCEE